VDAVSALIEAGANLNMTDEKGRSPMMLAASTGHADIVRALCKGGADVNIKDASDESALSLAGARGFLDIGHVLMKAGAQVDKSKWKWRQPRRKQRPTLGSKSRPRLASTADLSRKLLALPAPSADGPTLTMPLVKMQAWG
jgi:ankyrin repeat protein